MQKKALRRHVGSWMFFFFSHEMYMFNLFVCLLVFLIEKRLSRRDAELISFAI